MTNSERLRLLIKALNETQTSFAKTIEMPQSTISNAIMRNSNLNSQLMGRIIKAYPHVNIGWLMTGCGDMFKPNTAHSNAQNGAINTNFQGNFNEVHTSIGSSSEPDNSKKENTRLKKEITSIKGEVEKCRIEMDMLKAENERLKQEVESLTKELLNEKERLIKSLLKE